jgi:solute carrier family 25 citrate transporter 1
MNCIEDRELMFSSANFTAYSYLRKTLQDYQGTDALPGWQTSGIGLISGAMGPFSNAPIDTIKTRLQKTPSVPGDTALGRITKIAADMWKTEGVSSFYKGITPRVMRVAPGQAVTFTVYEYLRNMLENKKDYIEGGKYEE